MDKDFLTMLSGRARPLSRTVVFPDSLDLRTLRAVAVLRTLGALRPVLVGEARGIVELARRENLPIGDRITSYNVCYTKLLRSSPIMAASLSQHSA